MLGLMANMFKIPDLRKKILFTLAMIGVYRIGAHIPVPLIDSEAMKDFWQRMTGPGSGGILKFVDMFSGGAFRKMTVFALGIMPYISASIILQLLTVVWPWLEKISKEGEAGRKKINQFTRYGTVILAAFQSMGIGLWLANNNLMMTNSRLAAVLLTIIAITAGTCFIMWLGERITEKGIGNGISLIIGIGIIAGYPYSIASAAPAVQSGVMAPLWILVIFALYVVMSVAIIYMQLGARKIPIQHAKRVTTRGRIAQGATTHLPLKVNTAGVIPVIFSSAIMSFPSLVFGGLTSGSRGFFSDLGEMFSMTSRFNMYDMLGLRIGGVFPLLKSINLWMVIYSILTIFFCYFYTAITFNPVDVADNLKKSGGFIPGRRPGRSTSDYIDFVLTRVTLVGSFFLVFVALLPQIISISYRVPWQVTDLIGGTGLIIVVGVLLDTMKQIEAQLVMRHYESFRWRRGRRR